MAVRSLCRNYDQSPKKVRRLLDLVRGKPVREALAALQFQPSPAAQAISKALRSAIANAENNHMMAAEDLRVVKAAADDGPRLKRFRPQSRGRASPIIRRLSHITIEVDEEA